MHVRGRCPTRHPLACMFSHPTCVRFSPPGMDALNITLAACHRQMLKLQTWLTHDTDDIASRQPPATFSIRTLFAVEKGAQEKGAEEVCSAPFIPAADSSAEPTHKRQKTHRFALAWHTAATTLTLYPPCYSVL